MWEINKYGKANDYTPTRRFHINLGLKALYWGITKPHYRTRNFKRALREFKCATYSTKKRRENWLHLP